MKRFRNILVATDFSPASRSALRCAFELSAETGATLWIGHVVPPLPKGSVARVYRDMDAFLRRDAEKRLEALTKAARKRGARPRALLLQGSPSDALRRAASSRRADLLVLGTHGLTGLARFFIGSLAARIVATSPCPVLSVRRFRGSGKPRRILFATDFSEASRAAWKLALRLARANRARLRVVHVVSPLALGQGVRWAYAEAEAQARSDARRRLRDLREQARKAGASAEVLLLRAVPHEGIVRAARSMKDGWIVMGTHGRTGAAAAFVGSVASRVVATAPCPVLTVRSARPR
jgi:nucleotide-binding universal stress UspA family protein